MNSFNFGYGFGIETEYKISNNWQLSAYYKFSRINQSMIQKNFYGYLNNQSWSKMKTIYNNNAYAIQASYLYRSIYFISGIEYNRSNSVIFRGKHHYDNIGNDNNYYSTIGIVYDYGGLYFDKYKSRIFMPYIGFRKKINNSEKFQVGMLFYYPTKKMPDYNYNQQIFTDIDTIPSHTNYKSKQFKCELNIVYKIWSK